jgi:hypothetical protein
MVRLYSISLLFIFLTNITGGIALLMTQRYKRHEYVETMIRSETYRQHLTQIHIPKNEFGKIHWVEKGREFRYHGELYDIVRTEQSPDGSQLFHCILDHVESQLYSQLENNLGSSPFGPNSDQKIVIQLFNLFSHFLPPSVAESIQDFCKMSKGEFVYLNSFSSITLYLPSEPPERNCFIV